MSHSRKNKEKLFAMLSSRTDCFQEILVVKNGNGNGKVLATPGKFSSLTTGLERGLWLVEVKKIVNSRRLGPIAIVCPKQLMVAWTWKKDTVRRCYHHCLIVTPIGNIYPFYGFDIPDVVTVIKKLPRLVAKRPIFICASRQGTKICFLPYGSKNSPWPQKSWGMLILAVQKFARHVSPTALKVMFRKHWPDVARRLDAEKEDLFQSVPHILVANSAF